MAPTSRVTAPLGRRVSASSVMTYRMSHGAANASPAAGRNDVSIAPLRRRFSSWSFPRLRSHPIHACSLSFHRRRR